MRGPFAAFGIVAVAFIMLIAAVRIIVGVTIRFMAYGEAGFRRFGDPLCGEFLGGVQWMLRLNTLLQHPVSTSRTIQPEGPDPS